MKRTVILLLWCLAFLPILAQDLSMMKLSMKDGTNINIELDKSPEVMLDEETLVIKWVDSASPKSVSIDDVVDIRFTNISGIEAISSENAPDISFKVSGKTLRITNIPAESQLMVVSIAGITVLTRKVSDMTEINLNDFSSGIYVIRINDKSLKITL